MKDGRLYQKEVRIRILYRRIGRRFTSVQRLTYDLLEEGLLIHPSNPWLDYVKEEWLSKGIVERSRVLTRNRIFNGRRGTLLLYRTRNPGRFKQESRLFRLSRRVWNRRRRTFSWKWYESERELTLLDRRRTVGSSGRTLRRLWKGIETRTREIRKWIVWRGGVYSVRMRKERRSVGNRRSRRRVLLGYRRRSERRRRRRYRRKGRK